MIIPVRCFTCGQVVGGAYRRYVNLLEQGTPVSDALDQVGLRRYCCRRMLLTHVDLVQEIGKYRV